MLITLVGKVRFVLGRACHNYPANIIFLAETENVPFSSHLCPLPFIFGLQEGDFFVLVRLST